MRQHIFTFTVLATFAATHAWADAPRSVPIYMSDTGHILADATVNGAGPYTFIIDTAAGGTVVFEDFADEAGLEDIVSDQPIYVQGASGIVEARIVKMGEVQMGEWSFTIDRAFVLPTPAEGHIMGQGVIGIGQLLAQPIGFSLAEGRLDIYDQGEAIDAATELEGEWFSIPIEQRNGGFIWTIAVVNGVPIEVVIDTGARRSTINPAGARALGIDPDTADLVEDEPIRGATAHATPAWILPVATVQLGERVWGGRNLTLADASVFHAIGRGNEPTIIFGADLLTEQNFVIDPVANVLWMQKRQSAALGYLTRPSVEHSSAEH